jgi:hypothetical protein
MNDVHAITELFEKLDAIRTLFKGSTSPDISSLLLSSRDLLSSDRPACSRGDGLLLHNVRLLIENSREIGHEMQETYMTSLKRRLLDSRARPGDRVLVESLRAVEAETDVLLMASLQQITGGGQRKPQASDRSRAVSIDNSRIDISSYKQDGEYSEFCRKSQNECFILPMR